MQTEPRRGIALKRPAGGQVTGKGVQKRPNAVVQGVWVVTVKRG